MNITEPLRLAVGSHKAGSGKGCAMNVISWENGDTTITDLPACADPFLARVVQLVNDTICWNGSDLLCPECSVKVLELAHRTVGTTIPEDVARRVYVEIAVTEAESVLMYARCDSAQAACALARRFLAGDPVSRIELERAADAAFGASDLAFGSAAINAIRAAAGAVMAAARAQVVARAAREARSAVENAGYAALFGVDHDRLTQAHRIIDQFEQLAGVRAPAPDPERTRVAVAHMAAI